MKKIYVLFNPFTLGFDQMTTNADLFFIREIINPKVNDVERGKVFLEEIKEKLGEKLNKEDSVKMKLLLDNILPYLFLYEFRDHFEEYKSRRDFYLKTLLVNDPATHHILSHNKLRKQCIENVLNYTKIFGSPEARILLAEIEKIYNLDNPYEFQKLLDEERTEVATKTCRLANTLLEEALIHEKMMFV